MRLDAADHDTPLRRILAAAALAGIVSTLIGALFARAHRSDRRELDPEHPMFGRDLAW